MNNIELFENNKKIVAYCYSKLNKNWLTIEHREEILQEGFLALWTAINTFDSTRSETLSSYVFPCVRNAMLRSIRALSKSRADILSLNEPFKTSDEEYVATLADFIPVNDFEDSTDELVEAILDIYTKWLNKKHKHKETVELKISRAKLIINDALIEGKAKARTIEEKYGINRTTVSLILNEIRTVLKEEYPTRFKNRRQYKYDKSE